MKKALKIFWNVFKKIPAITTMTIFFIILSVYSESASVLLFWVLFLPGAVLIELMLMIPKMIKNDRERNARVWGIPVLTFRERVKRFFLK